MWLRYVKTRGCRLDRDSFEAHRDSSEGRFTVEPLDIFVFCALSHLSFKEVLYFMTQWRFFHNSASTAVHLNVKYFLSILSEDFFLRSTKAGSCSMAPECYFEQPEKLLRKRHQLLALCFHLVVTMVHCCLCFAPVAPLSSQSRNTPLGCTLSGTTHADEALLVSLYLRESNEYERLLRVTLLLLLLVLPAAADTHGQRARCGRHIRHGPIGQPAPLQRAPGLRPQEALLQRGGAQAAANDQEGPQDPGARQHESKF